VAALIAVEVCGALAHAHGVGRAPPRREARERDGAEGRLLKLMDFGIARCWTCSG
jgi:hypothetical protein